MALAEHLDVPLAKLVTQPRGGNSKGWILVRSDKRLRHAHLLLGVEVTVVLTPGSC